MEPENQEDPRPPVTITQQDLSYSIASIQTQIS